MYCTPYFSLVAELGHTTQERLNLATWISITFALGFVLASGAPAIGSSLGYESLQGLRVGLSVICGIAALCMYLPVLCIDEKRYCTSKPAQVGVIEALRRCVKNPHFRLYVTADFIYWFSTSIITTGLPYFLTVLLQISDAYQMGVTATIAAISFCFYYPTNVLAARFGKKRLVLLAMSVLVVIFALIFFLGWFPIPALVQVFMLGVLVAFPLAVLGVLPNAILADIAACDSRQTGSSQEGMYFAAHALLAKLGQSAGIMVFASLTNFGRDVGDDLGIRLSGPVGLVLCLVSLVLFCHYREDEVVAGAEGPRAADDGIHQKVEGASASVSTGGRFPVAEANN
jgi:GPH family glycoside/pentoside/hexuronide:cation symporter